MPLAMCQQHEFRSASQEASGLFGGDFGNPWPLLFWGNALCLAALWFLNGLPFAAPEWTRAGTAKNANSANKNAGETTPPPSPRPTLLPWLRKTPGWVLLAAAAALIFRAGCLHL